MNLIIRKISNTSHNLLIPKIMDETKNLTSMPGPFFQVKSKSDAMRYAIEITLSKTPDGVKTNLEEAEKVFKMFTDNMSLPDSEGPQEMLGLLSAMIPQMVEHIKNSVDSAIERYKKESGESDEASGTDSSSEESFCCAG